MNLDYIGVAQIQRGWSDFCKSNPGLKDCALNTIEQWNGEVWFEVTIGGLKHTHVFAPMDMNRHVKLRTFLVGLTEVGVNLGGTPSFPDGKNGHGAPAVIRNMPLGQRKLIIDHG